MVIRGKTAISPHDSECLAAVRAEAKNREVVVEGSRTIDTQPAHDSEARSIDNGKILVTLGNPNLPGGFEVCHAYRLDCCDSGSQPFPPPD